MSYIIEIGIEVRNEAEQASVEQALLETGCPFYVEPQRDPPWVSLADLECQCEGK